MPWCTFFWVMPEWLVAEINHSVVLNYTWINKGFRVSSIFLALMLSSRCPCYMLFWSLHLFLSCQLHIFPYWVHTWFSRNSPLVQVIPVWMSISVAVNDLEHAMPSGPHKLQLWSYVSVLALLPVSFILTYSDRDMLPSICTFFAWLVEELN